MILADALKIEYLRPGVLWERLFLIESIHDGRTALNKFQKFSGTPPFFLSQVEESEATPSHSCAEKTSDLRVKCSHRPFSGFGSLGLIEHTTLWRCDVLFKSGLCMPCHVSVLIPHPQTCCTLTAKMTRVLLTAMPSHTLTVSTLNTTHWFFLQPPSLFTTQYKSSRA